MEKEAPHVHVARGDGEWIRTRQSVGGFCGVCLTSLNLTHSSVKKIILSRILQPTTPEKISPSRTTFRSIS